MEKEDENYKKMKRIGESYYLLSENGQTGKLLVLDQELSVTEQDGVRDQMLEAKIGRCNGIFCG